MSEYKIVVEVRRSGTSKKATKPSASGGDRTYAGRKTSPKNRATAVDNEGSYSKVFQTIASATKNPSGAILKMAKSVPYVAASVIALKTTYEVIGIVTDLNASITGDYSQKLAYDNFKRTLQTALNPIGTALSATRSRIETYNTNLAQEQNRALMGEADLGGEGVKRI